MGATSLVWLRADLRLADNPALRYAVDHCERVLPVFIFDERMEDWPPGAASRWWLHHSLAALQTALQERDSRLVLRVGEPLEQLIALLEESGAEAVYWNRCYEPAAVARDRRIKQSLGDDGVEVASFNAALLHEPWELKTGSGDPYRVFSPFWRAALREGIDRPPQPAVRELRPVDRWPASRDLDDLGLLPDHGWDAGFHDRWQPGEAGATARLRRFLDDALIRYPDGRDHPGEAGTSGLSPHLRFGEIGPRQVVDAVNRHLHQHQEPGVQRGAEAYLREIGWREFAYHLLFHFPATTDQPLNPRFAAFPWRADYAADLDAWRRGRTGVPIVDAGMRELWATGWMHNRVRMIVGSYLVKNLLIPWQEGERWFWDTLVDADLASNTLGWQWVGGCGADAAPYFRIFNPVLQGEKFDTRGEYTRRWVPELAGLPDRWLHKPWEAPANVLDAAGLRLGEHYPAPLVDLKASRARALAAFEQVKG